MTKENNNGEPWETLTIANNVVEVYEDIILFLRKHNAALRKQLRQFKSLVAEQQGTIEAFKKKEMH